MTAEAIAKEIKLAKMYRAQGKDFTILSPLNNNRKKYADELFEMFANLNERQATAAAKILDNTVTVLPESAERVTAKEAAKYFKVDPKTISRWCKNGHLESIETEKGRHMIFGTSIRKLLLQPQPKK